MFNPIINQSRSTFGQPAQRGYQFLYHRGTTNHCPACGRTHWYVGRVSAECGFCNAAVPLAEAVTGNGTHSRNRRDIFADAA